MSELYIAGVDLLVPSGQRTVRVTPDWGIEVNGQPQTGYVPEDALVLSALCAQKDRVLTLGIMPELVSNTHKSAIGSGATLLPLLQERLCSEAEATSKSAVHSTMVRLLNARFGPLASNIYKLRLVSPVSYLFCTDITENSFGIRTIYKSESVHNEEYVNRFMAQHIKRLVEDRAWEKSYRSPVRTERTAAPPKPKNLPDIPNRQVRPANPQSKPPAVNRKRQVGLAKTQAQSLAVNHLRSILSGDAGSTVNSRQISDELTVQGLNRHQIQEAFNLIDVYIKPGYLVKTQDPDDNSQIMYRRTDVELRKK